MPPRQQVFAGCLRLTPGFPVHLLQNYIGGIWFAQHGVRYIELYNEPDLEKSQGCIDPERFVDDVRIRSMGFKDSFLDYTKGEVDPVLIGGTTAGGWDPIYSYVPPLARSLLTLTDRWMLLLHQGLADYASHLLHVAGRPSWTSSRSPGRMRSITMAGKRCRHGVSNAAVAAARDACSKMGACH